MTPPSRWIPRRRGPASRFMSLLGGIAFILGSIGWLVINEQGRRARVALLRAVNGASPRTRAVAGNLWRWGRQLWVDPWGPYRDQVAGTASGRVLEVGVGTWRNLRRYHEAAEVVGSDPRRRQVFAARRRARQIRPGAEVICAPTEALPFPDAAFDTVVTNLALCSVHDQAAALAEIARVLRPGGALRFLEHVRSPHRLMAIFQDLATPCWRLFVSGCHPNRDTLAAIRAAGFIVTELRHVTGAWGPARPTIAGVAIHQPIATPISDTLRGGRNAHPC